MSPLDKQIDVLKELINIGVGRGANVLNTMLHSHIRLQVPFVSILSSAELRQKMEIHSGKRLSAVNLTFKGSFSGIAELIFPSESASKLVTAFTGEGAGVEDLDSIRAGTLCEIGNIVLNALLGSISNLLQLHLNYSVPNYVEGNIDNLLPPHQVSSSSVILLARTRFTIEELEIDGDFVLFLEVGSFDKLLASINAFSIIDGEN